MKRSVSLIWTLVLLAPAAALGEIDLSKPMLCALTQAVECGYGDECSYGPPGDINLPTFVWVDPESMTLREHRGSRTSKMQTLAEKDGELLLHGYEERAFNISVSGETGRVTASALSQDVGFVVFGTCTNP